jgi:hypothetical protein
MAAKTTLSGTVLNTRNVKPFDANFRTIGTLVNPTWGAIPTALADWTLNWSRF